MEKFYNEVKNKGGRITPIKKAIIDYLISKECLITTEQIKTHLISIKLNPDRSTIFRELRSLSNDGIIVKNSINGTDYYEIPLHHHHHLVCLKCKKIMKIELHDQLTRLENELAQNNNFIITGHFLEFFGHCQKCI